MVSFPWSPGGGALLPHLGTQASPHLLTCLWLPGWVVEGAQGDRPPLVLSPGSSLCPSTLAPFLRDIIFLGQFTSHSLSGPATLQRSQMQIHSLLSSSSSA